MKASKRQTPAARQYFRSFYQNNRLRFVLAMTLTVLMSPGNLIGSWLLGEIIDVIAAGDLEWLGRTLLFTVIFLAVLFLVGIAMYRAKSSFVCRALTQYKSLAFQNLSEKSISAFARENTGRYISVLTNDVNSVEENYLKRTFVLLHHILLFFGSLGMMFWYSPVLALTTIALTSLPLAASILMGNELAVREKTVSDKNESFVSQLKDLLSGFSVIKSFKAEQETRQIFDAANREVEECKRRRYWWECLLSAVSQNLCSEILQFGIFFLGAYLAIRGDITAGTVLIFVNLCNFVIQPINIIPQYWASRKAAAGLIEKLAGVTEENAGRSGEAVEPVLHDAIALEHVSFGYEPEKPVLENVSLRLEAGKKYALVGASGSGKSTLLNLLMGAYDSYTGSIAIDGKELRDVDPDSLYDLMSLIGQNTFLFDDTIRRNITMFREFPAEQIDQAVRRSGLSELLGQRGEDYRCGENGVGLSGGERQRISIARCLLRGTPVLLLDEATAALDNQTAFAVTDAILHLDGLTRLVVTHRLEEALLAQYDEIIVLRGGGVCEQGTYQELMEEKGYFYSLYTVTNG
ncbi:MAG: ABC transporter ATP-binding protein/permease [Oscillospiraceae bacterium]|nr:ABC transporter ATP-binding protein/permease [Oscillospiraceae bacterium]